LIEVLGVAPDVRIAMRCAHELDDVFQMLPTLEDQLCGEIKECLSK
jgi:hypothetical protein